MFRRSGGLLLPALLLMSVVLVGCPEDPRDYGAKPEARFESAPVSGHPPLTVEFFDQSSAGASAISDWYWEFGDSTSSTDANPRHIYYQAGNYTVSLRVTTALGVSTKTIANCVRVVDPIAVAGIDSAGGSVEAFGGKLTAPPGAFKSRVIVGFTAGEGQMPVDLTEREVLVSQVYTLSHDQCCLRIDPRSAVEMDLPFAVQRVPEADRTSDKVYLFARLENGARVPIPGRVDGDRFWAPLAGLPTRADYAVVYRPEAMTETVAVEDELKQPTSYRWYTSAWRMSYTQGLLQALTALDLGNVDALMWYDMREFPQFNVRETQQRLRDTVEMAHSTAEAAGLISPALNVTPANEYNLMFYQMKPQPLSTYANVGETMFATSLFGSVVIDPEQLVEICRRQAEAGSDGRQELEFVHAFTEEFFRSIFRGYNYPALATVVQPQYGSNRQPQASPFDQGLCEGLAAYLGQLAAGEIAYRPSGTNYMEIHRARALSPNEYAMLSEPLLAPASNRVAAYATATQDFFFYVTNRYSRTDPLTYVADSYDGVLEQTRLMSHGTTTYEDAMTAARMGLDVSLQRTFELSLPEVYWEYARARAYENPANSKLRASDVARKAFTFNDDRFDAGGVIRYTCTSLSPQLFSYRGYDRLDDIPPLTTVAIVLTAQGISCDLKIGVNAYDWMPDSYGNSVRVKAYKSGADGVELTPAESEKVLTGFGSTTGFSKAVLLIGNVSMEQAYSVEVTVEPRAN